MRCGMPTTHPNTESISKDNGKNKPTICEKRASAQWTRDMGTTKEIGPEMPSDQRIKRQFKTTSKKRGNKINDKSIQNEKSGNGWCLHRTKIGTECTGKFSKSKEELFEQYFKKVRVSQ